MILTFSLASNKAQASQVLNIGLTRFEAIPLNNAVRLEWDTETELGTAGYKLKRGQNGTFSYLQDPTSSIDLFIPSEGGPSQGSSYSFLDGTAVNGQSYTYQLIEVTADGGEAVHAEKTVTAGVAPTNTPILLGNGGGNNKTSTPLPTTTATATQSASNTPNPSSTPVPSVGVSITPIPTAKNTPLVNESQQVIPSPEIGTESFSEDAETNPVSEFQPSTDPGIAVAQAMEEPSQEQIPSYPGIDLESPTQESTQTLDIAPATQQEEIDSSNDINNSSQPAVIGNIRSINNTPTPDNDNTIQDSNASQGATAGRVYLWVAFIAALVIFVAAVLGAILLYTRRQKRE